MPKERQVQYDEESRPDWQLYQVAAYRLGKPYTTIWHWIRQYPDQIKTGLSPTGRKVVDYNSLMAFSQEKDREKEVVAATLPGKWPLQKKNTERPEGSTETHIIKRSA